MLQTGLATDRPSNKQALIWPKYGLNLALIASSLACLYLSLTLMARAWKLQIDKCTVAREPCSCPVPVTLQGGGRGVYRRVHGGTWRRVVGTYCQGRVS